MDVRNRREHALHGKVQGEEIYVLPHWDIYHPIMKKAFSPTICLSAHPPVTLKKSTPEDVPDVFCCALDRQALLFDASVHCLDYLANLK